MANRNVEKQNVTISISPDTIRKARILAARRSALFLLERGFHLCGVITASRDELHER
jgi:hypothetical protein